MDSVANRTRFVHEGAAGRDLPFVGAQRMDQPASIGARTGQLRHQCDHHGAAGEGMRGGVVRQTEVRHDIFQK